MEFSQNLELASREFALQAEAFYDGTARRASNLRKEQRKAVIAVFGKMKATWGRDGRGPRTKEEALRIKRVQLSRDKARHRHRKNLMKAAGWDPAHPEIIPSSLRSTQ